MGVQNQRLQKMFDSDSAIMLETLERMLSKVGPGRLDGPDVDRAFRAAHSIKSEAGFLNLTDIASAAHRLEDALSGVRHREGTIDEAAAQALHAGLRSLSEALREYRDGRAGRISEAEPDGSGPTLEAVGETAAARTSTAELGMLREARQRGEHLYRVSVSLDSVPEMRYARAFLVVNNLELSCAVVRSDPSLEDARVSESDRMTLLITSPGEEDVVHGSVERAVHVDEVELIKFSEVSFDDVLAGLSGGGGAGTDETMTEPTSGDERRVRSIDAESQEEVRLFAEEIIVAADELSDSDGDASDGVERLARIRRYAEFLRDRMSHGAPVQLVDVLREIRSSAVRYAARQGKRVRVVVGGQGALVSSTVGDTVLEAVMHLVRNSVDHGIATLDARARAGRHPAATIKVRVDGNAKGVRVVLQDDGAGIDESAVRARADDPESSLLDILARPGFSMREAPDATSGRGVGLDNVVHSIRTLLGGEIRMINKPESGLTFVISVPAAARLVHVLIVESGDLAYAVPTATVVTRSPLQRRRIRRDSFGALYYEHEGKALALTTMTGRTPNARALSEGAAGIVVRAGGELRVLVADGVLGEEAVVREDARVERVYSRSLGRDIRFVFPAALGSGQVSAED